MLKGGLLLFFDYFDPAVKPGGPIRSAKALASHLSSRVPVFVFTSSNDLHDQAPMQNIFPDEWNSNFGFRIFYASHRRFLGKIITVCRQADVCIYHFNSFFSFRFSVLPMVLIQLGIIPKKPVVISPRGELSEAARTIKRFKKKVYLAMFKCLWRSAVFHATDHNERLDIERTLQVHSNRIFTAPNLRAELSLPAFNPSRKSADNLQVVSVSRISRIKNIDFIVRALELVKANVEVDIYGFLEDQSYFDEIMTEVASLPPNVRFSYRGSLEGSKVGETIQKYDLFFSPSKSENFGHAILEALTASRPVLISELTYWRDVSNWNAGWALPVHDPSNFSGILDFLADLSPLEHNRLCEGAQLRASHYFAIENNPREYLKAYDRLLKETRL